MNHNPAGFALSTVQEMKRNRTWWPSSIMDRSTTAHSSTSIQAQSYWCGMERSMLETLGSLSNLIVRTALIHFVSHSSKINIDLARLVCNVHTDCKRSSTHTKKHRKPGISFILHLQSQEKGSDHCLLISYTFTFQVLFFTSSNVAI